MTVALTVSSFALILSAGRSSAWVLGSRPWPALPRSPPVRPRTPALRASALQDAKQTQASKHPSTSVSRAWRHGRDRGSSLRMASAAREGDVALQSVKVGPLKQESVLLPTGVSMQTIYQKPATGSPPRRLDTLQQETESFARLYWRLHHLLGLPLEETTHAKHKSEKNDLHQQKMKPPDKANKVLPPLVFIHGSYHGAWCWAEHWTAFLAAKGYESYSISLRGTSGTPIPGEEENAKGVKVKMSEHVADVRGFAETVLPARRPVFISHSFGALVLLKLMEQLAGEAEATDPGETGTLSAGGSGTGGVQARMAGAVFMCPVPPSGTGPMTKRFIRERPVMAVKIVLGFVLKMATYWPWLARDLFFSRSLEQATLKRYLSNFQADSKNGLDLGDLRSSLPIKQADEEGRVKWVKEAPPRLVVSAERDRIVDEAGIEEMATFLDTQHIMLPTVPHEVMLGPDWPRGVDRLLQWLEATDFAPAPEQ